MGFGRVFLFIFIFALLEAVVLGQVAQAIGWGITILLTVFTALLGSILFRWQGLETWMRLNQRLQQGEVPGTELVEGVMLLLGGALLITPGFITDGVGFLLLIPPSRRAMAGYLARKGTLQSLGGAGNGGFWVYQRGSWSTGPRPRPGPEPRQDEDRVIYKDRQGHYIIEGEAEHKEDA